MAKNSILPKAKPRVSPAASQRAVKPAIKRVIGAVNPHAKSAKPPRPEVALAQRLFSQAEFTISAAAKHQLPRDGLPEVAFCGRSNAGKSSALNTICNRKKLAFVSKTPGRTQLINIFGLGFADQVEQTARQKARQKEYEERDRRAPVPAVDITDLTDVGSLVDLPGYGFAAAPMAVKKGWEALVGAYLSERESLAGVVLVMDIRHPLTPLDWELIEWVRPDVTPVHALLTKCDKLSKEAGRKVIADVRKQLSDAGYQVSASLFSSLNRDGVEDALAALVPFFKLMERLPPNEIEPK